MANAAIVTRDVVEAVRPVPFTDTWHPVTHNAVLQTLDDALENSNLEIRKERYSLSLNGLDMFGQWTLNHGTNGRQWSLGIRNSMQKRFALGVCAGFNIIVCSNLVFSGDYITFRKHTSGLDMDEMRMLANSALKNVLFKMNDLGAWIDGLHNHQLERPAFKTLTYDAMKAGVFAPSKFKEFLNCYQAEQALNQESTAYTFHNAVTRLHKGNNLLAQAERCAGLEVLMDKYCHDEVLYRDFN